MTAEAPDGVADWTALATALLERELARTTGEGVPEAAEAAVSAARAAFEAALSDPDTAPLAAVAAAAELTSAQTRLLGVCGAIDLDRRLQRLVSVLTSSSAPGRADLDLLARLLGAEVVDALSPDGRLVSCGLLELEDGVPLAAARVGVPRVVGWALLGDLSLDPDLPRGAEAILAPEGALGGPERVLVHGEDRVRRLQTAIVATWGLAFLVTAPPTSDDGWLTLVRQATVLGAGVVLDLAGPPDELARHWMARADHLSWALCCAEPLPLESLPELAFVEVETGDRHVSPPEWAAAYPGVAVPGRRPTATQLALLQRIRPADGVPPLRRLAAGTLRKHARRVTPSKTWDDLILPAAQERRLRQLVARYRQRTRVHEEWGLDLYPSPGVVALFSGPSGTGKTTSAEVIAAELGVDLFRVDLSARVSKYIGETEKNLEEIFSAAHAGDYLLLFDEADSLFGQRSAVTDARDRYANMEVSYLLQRLETYDGFVILTSNFQGNIDDAFLRRIHAAIHFPVPTSEDRERIWARALGAAPLADVDLGDLARSFELTGGSIRNAALTGAFLAADADRAVGMPDVLAAVAQELTKLKQRVTVDMFGPWAPLMGQQSPG